MFLIISLHRCLQDVPHGQPPVSVPLPPHLDCVPVVPVQAELVEPDQLVDGFGFSIYLSFLPLAVSGLGHQGVETEPSGHCEARNRHAVLIPHMHALYLQLDVVHEGGHHGLP